MKKAFFILGTPKRKAWAAILCCAIILSLSTGMTFASNANAHSLSGQVTESANTVPVSPQEQAKLVQQRKDEKTLDYFEYSAFGMTYDMERDLFLYDGKVVRRFYDEVAGRGFTSNNYAALDFADYDKSVDLTAVRNTSGKLTGFSSANKEHFDQRTARIEQMRKQSSNQDAAAGSFSVSESTSDSSSNKAGAVQSNQNITEADRRADQAWSYNPNFVDTTLNAYIDYGVSYDKANKEWVFNQKVIALLIDTDYQIYVNLPADDTDGDYTEAVVASKGAFLKVTRKSNGSIDKIVEMTVDEAAKTLNTLFIS